MSSNWQRARSNRHAVGALGVPLAMIMILTSFPAGSPHGQGTAVSTPPLPRATHFAPATESMCAPG
jgi:hypothetical protein